MGEFDNLIGNWIQIEDTQTEINLNDFSFETGIIKEQIDNHCVPCIASNKCYYKNEEGKRPPKQVYNSVRDLNLKNAGLFHYNCHCKELNNQINSIDEINLLIPDGKKRWVLSDKLDWIISMGYEPNDYFLKTVEQCVKEAYFYGRYKIRAFDKYGMRIDLSLKFPGHGEKQGKIYDLKSGFSIFPEKTLKCNTYVGGWHLNEIV